MGGDSSTGAEEEAPSFVEILPRNANVKLSQAYAEAYVGTVDPQQCGALIQRLSATLPLDPPSSSSSAPTAPDFSCLKRVKRTTVSEPDDSQSDFQNCGASSNGGSQGDQLPHVKKQRVEGSEGRTSTRPILQVLLGPVDQVEACAAATESKGDDASSDSIDDVIVRMFDLRRLDRIRVPALPADSEAEWKEFQKVWPSSFHPHRTTEFRERSLQVSPDEIEQMKRGMGEALLDASRWASSSFGLHGAAIGTVVVDPATGHTVARASDEHVLQSTPRLTSDAVRTNPLQTSVVLAIQAVSRIERRHAELSAAMDGPEFQAGQYLCTGYDVYTTAEPSAYEAMALVHARIRRLVFDGCGASGDDGHPSSTAERQGGGDAGVGGAGGITEHGVHALPGTNHKYRAFMCSKGSSLRQACRDSSGRLES